MAGKGGELTTQLLRPVKLKVERISDLTQENLNKIFQHYFQDKTLSVEILKGHQNFLGQNDQFQSDIKKWEVNIIRQGEKKNLSFIVKTTTDSSFQQFNTRISRQFFTETFWYKFAFPTLKKDFPELAPLSPTWYFAYSNYEDSFRADYCDKSCGYFCRAFHHKNEVGIILMENACEEDRHTGFPTMVSIDKTKVMSLNQVKAAMKALAVFHGAWWVWLRKKKREEFTDYVDNPMNIEDIEEAFMKLRKIPIWSTKSFFGEFARQFPKLLKNFGGDEKLVARLKFFVKNKLFVESKRMFEPEIETSVMKTMTHGDYWVNNMLFSSSDPEDAELTVTMLDFQLMTLAHPARDIWYLLYCNTDKEFRDKHLQEILQEYFNIFSSYLQLEKITISFQDFLKDISYLRAFMALTFSVMVQFLALSPEPLSFSTMRDIKVVQDTFKQQVASPPKESDDPMIKEMRRRMLGIIYELDNEGLL